MRILGIQYLLVIYFHVLGHESSTHLSIPINIRLRALGSLKMVLEELVEHGLVSIEQGNR